MLSVSPGAEQEVVKAAYTALARKHHPDAGGSAQRMKDINEAWEVLSDPLRKVDYDLYRRQRAEEGDKRYAYDGSRPSTPPPTSPPSRKSPGEGILPWPSLAWQRVALFTSIPLGLGLMLLPFGLWYALAGLFILFTACYASIKTRGLSRIENRWTAVKVGAGFCITSSLCILGAIVLVLSVVFITVVAIIAVVRALTAS